MKRMVLVGIFLWSTIGFCQSGEIDQYALRDLYVFRPTIISGEDQGKPQENKLTIILTMASHLGSRESFEVFSHRARYSIYISHDDDVVSDFEINLFTGGPGQYRIDFNGQHELLGRLGEASKLKLTENEDIHVYVGIRRDPRFYDEIGFSKIRENPCVPAIGLRCELGDFVENAFANKNVGALVIDMPITLFNGKDSANEEKIKVWAKLFEQSDS